MNCLAITSIFGTILVYGLNQIYERVMQDFTKPLVAINAAPTSKSKWLTKDRFWNFVFWFGMSFGMASAAFIKSGLGLLTLSKVVMWSTIILVPMIVVLSSKTSFIKKDTFVNSEGITLTKKQLQEGAFLAFLSGFGLAFIIAETILPKGLDNFFAALVFFLSLLSGVSLFFIYKNCPISILFNLRYWELCLSNSDGYKTRTRNSSRFVTHPVYKFLPYNIFHKRR